MPNCWVATLVTFLQLSHYLLITIPRLSCWIKDREQQSTLLLFMVTGKHLKMETKHILKAQMPKGTLYF